MVAHLMISPELRSHLEELAKEMKKQFGSQSQFQENGVRLSGSKLKRGMVTWTSESLSVELTLGLMAKMFKSQIQEEIERQINVIVVS